MTLTQLWKDTVDSYVASFLAAADAKVSVLETTINTLTTQLETSNGEKAHLALQINSLNIQIGQLNAEIAELRKQLEANYDEVVDGNVQALLTAKPQGATIKLPPAVYRLTQPLSIKMGQKIFAPGSVFKGSAVAGTWTAATFTDAAGIQRQAYYATGLLPAAYTDKGVCEIIAGDEANSCQQLEDVYLNGTLLTRVMQLKNLSLGKVFTDYKSGRIYIFDIPNNVEVAKVRHFMNTTVADARLSGATVTQFASPSQLGALTVSGKGWEIDNCTFTKNHSSGLHVTLADGLKTHHNTFEANGQAGMTHHKSHGTEITYNLFRGNNTAGYYKRDWESAGLKITFSDGTLVQFNTVDSNQGVGIWLDIDNRGYKILDNRIVDNFSCGIRVEISLDGEIRRNKIFRNGFGHAGPGRGSDYSAFATAGIHINSAGGVGELTLEITDNLIGIDMLESGAVVSVGLANQNAIHLEERFRGPSKTYPNITWMARNIKVRNNHVNVARAKNLAGTGVVGLGVLNGTSKSVYEVATGNVFEGNKYYGPDKSLPQFHVYDTGINQYRDFAGWQRKGWDKTNSSFTVIAAS